MDDGHAIPGATLADALAEIAALKALVADLRTEVALLLADPSRARPKPRKPPRAEDRAILAGIIEDAPHGATFQFSDFDEPEVAKLRGEALARLLPRSPVDGVAIERHGELGGVAVWLIRLVEGT